MESMRGFFRLINRLFMVPLFRLGLGSAMANPFTGYVMVLAVKGHKTGKVRFVPVNYAVDGGCVHCVAGLGRRAHWYRNLQADPNLDVLLPGGTIHGRASEITDPAERLRLSRKIFRAAGFAPLLEGLNPFSCTDEKLAAAVKGSVVFRIEPTGIGSGPADHGGGAWILFFLAGSVLCILLAAWAVAGLQ